MEANIQADNCLIEFLKLTLIRCMDALKASSGSIFLLDDNYKELVLKVAINPEKRPLEGIREKLNEGISGRVAFQREALLVEDIRKDSRFRNKPRFDHYQTNSFLSVPLTSNDKVIGVINITEHFSGQPYQPEDLKYLLNICSYLDLAIYGLRKSEELKNAQLRELKRELEISDKLSSLGRFAAGLIHELNNPLDGIIRYTNLCLDYSDENTVIREYLLEAKKGLNRITKIVRSLLDFAQTSSPSFNKPIDVNKSIEDCLFMMGQHISANKIEVVKQFAPDLPVVQDKGLKLAFNNLIINACDAIGAKGGKIQITTRLQNGFVEVKFTDSGPGIPEEIQDRIFEPFFTTKEMGKGAGLGLAICHDIVRRYKGNIFVDSKKGQEATFIIQLPNNAGK